MNLYRVATLRNHVWVAARSESEARKYGFNLLDDAKLPELLAVRNYGFKFKLKLPGDVRHELVVALIGATGLSGKGPSPTLPSHDDPRPAGSKPGRPTA